MGDEPKSIAWSDIEDGLSMSDPFTCFLHRTTGSVVILCTDSDMPDEAEEYERILDDPAYIEIPREESREGYDDMASFAQTIDEDDIRDKIEIALGGRGAFRRFREVLHPYPDLRQHFEAHQRQARIARIQRWLSTSGIELDLVVEDLPSPVPDGSRDETPIRPGLIELLMLGGKTEYVDGAVRRHMYCDSPSDARAAFKRIAREVVEAQGLGWRKRYVQGTSEFDLGRFHLSHDGRHLVLLVKTGYDVFTAFSQ